MPGGPDDRLLENKKMKMHIKSLLGQIKRIRLLTAALLTASAVGGWGAATLLAANAAVVENATRLEQSLPPTETKTSLVGSYAVTGTDPDGRPYGGTSVVDISLAPSGALELEWDNGRQVGVGQVVGNTLAVACLSKGRTSILVMNINPDGSLSGAWSRRTDRGSKATERWKRS